jgi:hypothetical protein
MDIFPENIYLLVVSPLFGPIVIKGYRAIALRGEAAVQSLIQFGKLLFDAFWAQTQATATQLKEISSFRSMGVLIGPPNGFWQY